MSSHDYDYPRPWVVDDNREGFEGLISIFDASGKTVACTGDMESAGHADIRNAHWIAAAPELLEACKADVAALKRIAEIVSEVTNGITPERVALDLIYDMASIQAGVAAIARAEGGAA